jgi:cob(I)alamin adenosyltransferase
MIEPDTITNEPFWQLDEVRGGLLKHAIDDQRHESGAGFNFEVLGGRFPGGYDNPFLDFFLTPRPDFGVTLTNARTDQIYWGVTWDVKLYEPLFIEGTFGGAAHDGPVSVYGCDVNFREGASLGWALTENWRVLGIIEHMSNANLCDKNRGLTNAGIRIGYHW